MEAGNLLTSYEREAAGKTRKYYKITKKARKLWAENRKSGMNIPKR